MQFKVNDIIYTDYYLEGKWEFYIIKIIDADVTEYTKEELESMDFDINEYPLIELEYLQGPNKGDSIWAHKYKFYGHRMNK